MKQIIGAGLACIDLIYDSEQLTIQNGGTCSNVLSALSSLGWNSILVKPQYAGNYEKIMDNAFQTLGMKTVRFKKTKVSTPRIIEKRNQDHVFYTKCPCCGKKILNLVLPTENNIKSLNIDFSHCDIFFHDRVSSGIKEMVELANLSGGMAMYEPNGFRNEQIFSEHCLKCNIIKFSNERISMDVAERLRTSASKGRIQLIICTDSDKGLRFSYRISSTTDEMSSWQTIPPLYFKNVYDTSGAGDWFTAGFLNEWLNKNEKKSLFQETVIVKSLEKSRTYARESTAFLGAQGLLYSKEYMDRKNRRPLSHTLPKHSPLSSCPCCGEVNC